MAVDMDKVFALAGNNLASFTALQKDASGHGSADHERVQITITGEHMIKDLTLAPELVERRSSAEISQLVVTAYNRARADLDRNLKEATLKMVKEQGLDLSGLTK